VNPANIAPIIYWLTLSLCILLIMRWGAAIEKTAVLAYAVAFVLSVVLPGNEDAFRQLEVQILIIDLIMLLFFGWLALTSTRFWPLWATSFHCIPILTHLVQGLIPEPVAVAYYLMQGKASYAVLLSIVLGAYGHNKVRQMKAHHLEEE
jgi:hypothetical protein